MDIRKMEMIDWVWAVLGFVAIVGLILRHFATQASEAQPGLTSVTSHAPVKIKEPEAVRVELHVAPDAPHLEGVSVASSPAEAYQRWKDSEMCDPSRLGFPGNFATRGPQDLSKHQYVVSQRLGQIKSGEWVNGQIEGGASGK